MPVNRSNGYLAQRPLVLGLGKVLALVLGQIPLVQALPLHASKLLFAKDDEAPAEDPDLWLYLGVAAALVIMGGAFAGLTIALMGQDEIYLQVIKTSGEGAERKQAAKVLALLNKGKHWVLVTLLLGNVITNETLPIVLDRSLGGGWPAVLGSTVLIVIFGEIAPQSVCVRYGLPIGAWMAPFVLALMYILAPVAWPTAKLLDWLLGEDHGTVYKKAGLKTLVSLHKSLGDAGQQLNTDEVTIISAVLDLKEKSVGSIMTPMEDVFTLSLDDILDEETMDILVTQGYSRIPVHHPDSDSNFVGMLLVKMLITYDPEDAKPVRDFALATLPETAPDTSCLDIINFFQEGKSHMVLVSDVPGGDHGALGVCTLEDVIEELIGEEIVDESDVFIDVHKAIRRTTWVPRLKPAKSMVVEEPPSAVTATNEADLIDIAEGEPLLPDELQRAKTSEAFGTKSKITHRRRSSAANSAVGDTKYIRKTNTDIKEHLKHLGPSNLASRPRSTRYNTVFIKPGQNSLTASPRPSGDVRPSVDIRPSDEGRPTGDDRMTPARRVSETISEYRTGIGENQLTPGGKSASDGAQALLQKPSAPNASPRFSPQAGAKDSKNDLDDLSRERSGPQRPGSRDSKASATSRTVGSVPQSGEDAQRKSPAFLNLGPTRSGSLTEHVRESNGIRKMVLETTSSSSNDDDENSGASKGHKPSGSTSRNRTDSTNPRGDASEEGPENAEHGVIKKKRRKKRKPGHGHGHAHGSSEHEPLLSAGR